MSSTQSERGFWTGIKCSGCRNDVENPVQLPACLHIVCLNCLHNLESNSAHNICCPKCGDENARPGVLQIISGVEKSSRENMLCDLEPEHGIAKWNCFECGLNMCGSCRVNHVKDHNIKLLGHLQVLSNTIWEQKDNKDSKTAITSNTVGQVNRSTLSFTHCPICNESNCQHVQLLQNLTDRPLNSVIHCQQDGHIDVELKYFCHECWIPVCGDCSQKGKHKLHKCDDISSCGKEYLVKSLATLKEELHILVETSKQDVAGIKTVEEQLRQHVEDTDRELNSRKLKGLTVIKCHLAYLIVDSKPAEVYKVGGSMLMKKLFHTIWWNKELVPHSLKEATIVHLYKHAQNSQSCNAPLCLFGLFLFIGSVVVNRRSN